MRILAMLAAVFICGGCGVLGEYLNDEEALFLADHFTAAGERIAADPSILNTANEFAGAAGLAVMTIGAAILRKRNATSDLRKTDMEADIAALKNGGTLPVS